MGEEIASLPTSELLDPLGRVMFPVFAAVKHDAAELLRVVRMSLAVQALLAMPAGVGVALVADDAIATLLGDNWLSAATYARIIGVTSIALTLCHSSMYLLNALGQMRRVAVYNWARVAMLVILAAFAFPSSGALGVAWAYLVTAFVGLVVVQVLARPALPGFTGWTFLLDVWGPVAATAHIPDSCFPYQSGHELSQKTSPDRHHGLTKAHYSPVTDTVNLSRRPGVRAPSARDPWFGEGPPPGTSGGALSGPS